MKKIILLLICICLTTCGAGACAKSLSAEKSKLESKVNQNNESISEITDVNLQTGTIREIIEWGDIFKNENN